MGQTLQSKGERQKYNAVDIAKFICAVFVVMIHIPPFGSADSGAFYYLNFYVKNYIARIAVPFFFVTSGFLLFRKTSPDDFKADYPIKYAKRLLRIYLIWSVIYLPLSIIDLKGKYHNDLKRVILRYLHDFIFQGSYGHLWYLTALIFSVLLITFLLKMKMKPKHILIGAACFFVIGLFAQSWFGFIVPLREAAPQLWSMLLQVKSIILTTRDGLFEGFFFVAVGMCIAYYGVPITRTKALIGWIVSMTALFFEFFLLEHLHFIRGHAMYLFLAPASFFLLCWLLQIRLPEKPIYKTLRLLSSLIYFSHLWIKTIVVWLLRRISIPLLESCLLFLLSLLVTILFSLVVIKLSEKKGFNWIRWLYG